MFGLGLVGAALAGPAIKAGAKFVGRKAFPFLKKNAGKFARKGFNAAKSFGGDVIKRGKAEFGDFARQSAKDVGKNIIRNPGQSISEHFKQSGDIIGNNAKSRGKNIVQSELRKRGVPTRHKLAY